MTTEYLRVLVNTVAIRDEPGSTDRLGDFTKNDAVKLVQPCPSNEVPEWVEVDMVGAIREPAEEGHERAVKLGLDLSHRIQPPQRGRVGFGRGGQPEQPLELCTLFVGGPEPVMRTVISVVI